jgi:hypothetical protein
MNQPVVNDTISNVGPVPQHWVPIDKLAGGSCRLWIRRQHRDWGGATPPTAPWHPTPSALRPRVREQREYPSRAQQCRRDRQARRAALRVCALFRSSSCTSYKRSPRRSEISAFQPQMVVRHQDRGKLGTSNRAYRWAPPRISTELRNSAAHLPAIASSCVRSASSSKMRHPAPMRLRMTGKSP